MELARLSWPDARDAIRQARVALLPVGAIEQHGPHLPLGTDWYIASHIAQETTEQDGLLLLPGFAVGVSYEHRQFWGYTLQMAVLQAPQHVLRPVSAETHIDGVSRGIILVPILLAPAFPAVCDRIADH